MIAYTKNDDNSINVLGGSDRREVLDKLFHGQDFLVTEDEPVTAGGKTYLSADEPAYQEAKLAEEKAISLAQLDTQYTADKEELARYFLQFQMAGDTVGMMSIQAELEELNKQYDTALADIEGGE